MSDTDVLYNFVNDNNRFVLIEVCVEEIGEL